MANCANSDGEDDKAGLDDDVDKDRNAISTTRTFIASATAYSGYSFNCLSTTPRAASESSEYIIGYSKYLLCVKQNKIGVITLLST